MTTWIFKNHISISNFSSKYPTCVGLKEAKHPAGFSHYLGKLEFLWSVALSVTVFLIKISRPQSSMIFVFSLYKMPVLHFGIVKIILFMRCLCFLICPAETGIMVMIRVKLCHLILCNSISCTIVNRSFHSLVHGISWQQQSRVKFPPSTCCGTPTLGHLSAPTHWNESPLHVF